MTPIEQIIARAEQIRDGSNTNWDNGDREIAGLIARIAGVVASQQAVIDNLVAGGSYARPAEPPPPQPEPTDAEIDAELCDAGIDMREANKRLQEIIAARRAAKNPATPDERTGR